MVTRPTHLCCKTFPDVNSKKQNQSFYHLPWILVWQVTDQSTVIQLMIITDPGWNKSCRSSCDKPDFILFWLLIKQITMVVKQIHCPQRVFLQNQKKMPVSGNKQIVVMWLQGSVISLSDQLLSQGLPVQQVRYRTCGKKPTSCFCNWNCHLHSLPDRFPFNSAVYLEWSNKQAMEMIIF